MDFILNLDEKVLLFIQEHMRMPILDEIMVFFTTLGDAGLLWIVLALAFLITKKYRRNGAMMALALVFGLIITNVILKNAVARIITPARMVFFLPALEEIIPTGM